MISKQQKQQVKEAVIHILKLFENTAFYPYSSSVLEAQLDQILNLTYPNGQPMLGILDEKQELDPPQWTNEDMIRGWRICLKVAKINGWRKCLL